MQPSKTLLALLLLALLSFALHFHLRRKKPPPPAFSRKTHPSSTFPAPFLDTFCHTDQGLRHRQHNPAKPSHRNCFGSCFAHQNNTNVTTTILPFAIEAPRVSALCLSNPFHAFYDCIWPLLHYLTTCAPFTTTVTTPHPQVILLNNEVFSAIRQRKWAVRAQLQYLRNLPQTYSSTYALVEKNRLPANTCLCFRSTLIFQRDTLWRPTRFHYTYSLRNRTIQASHPGLAKRHALRSFRSIVLTSLARNPTPQTYHNLRRSNPLAVLVYDRADARRRKWTNAQQFVQLLSQRLDSEKQFHHMRISILHSTKVPKAFEQQVEQYNDAALVVAPHGAAMVNTLFMRDRSAVLEIASKHCFTSDGQYQNHSADIPFSLDMDVVQNVSDPNAWVPWHAHSLGLYHVTAPCFALKRSESEFETDNHNLLELAVVLLMLVTKPDGHV